MSAEFLWKINRQWARRIRVGVIGSTVISVPSIYLLANGPYLKEYFEKRYDVLSVIPSHLQQIIDSVSCTKISIGSVNLIPANSVLYVNLSN